MKIGVELRQIVLGPSGGVALMLQGLLEAVFTHHSEHEIVLFCTEVNNQMFGPSRPNVRIITLPDDEYWPRLDKLAHAHRLDVLFRTVPLNAPIKFPLAKQVFLLVDLQHEFFPHFFDRDAIAVRRISFGQAMGYAGAVVTLSEHARQTILDHPDTRCQDVSLVSPALPSDPACDSSCLSEVERALLPTRPYFFFPANLWPHKNHRRVLRAFALFLQKTQADVELILTGHPSGWDELSAECEGLPVRHLGFVSPPLLRALMERARALLFFTLFEGFGMPILEAFHAGTPVLCSNFTSHPEIGGDAVLTCDPTNSASMSQLMIRIWNDEPLRAQMIARGKQRLAFYTYEKSAANLIDACRRVASAGLPAWEMPRETWQPPVTHEMPSRSILRTLVRAVRHPIRALKRLGRMVSTRRAS